MDKKKGEKVKKVTKHMARKGNPISERFLFLLKVGYLQAFFILFSISYKHIFPDFEEENYTRALQVFLQLAMFLFHFRSFKTKAEKEAKWLLLMSCFYSVVATLFLKNLVSIDCIVFVIYPIFALSILFIPAEIIPFTILLPYSLEKGLAFWTLCLLLQLAFHYALSALVGLEDRPKRSIYPLLSLVLLFFHFGRTLYSYSADLLHEPARLSAIVSGTCIIFMCLKRRGKLAFICSFGIYFLFSVVIGIISIASSPGGNNISCPIPFLFIGCHFLIFGGLFLFQRNIRAERQPLVPLLFGGLLFFLTDFPNMEWLEGWIEGLDLFLLLLGMILFVCGEESK